MLFVLSAFLTVALASVGGPIPRPFFDFDSRLNVRAAFRHAPQPGLQAFRVIGAETVLVYPDHLTFHDSKMARRLNVDPPARFLLRMSNGPVLIVSGERVMPLTGAESVSPQPWLVPPKTWLDARGTDTILQASQGASEVLLRLRARDGLVLNLARIPGVIRAVAWNTHGLAAVIGDAVFRLEPGASQLVVLDRHADYTLATDVVALPGKAALVALQRTVRLLRPDYSAIVLGLAARLDWVEDQAVILDLVSGTVWTVRGLDALRSRQKDLDYAAGLLRRRCRGEPCPERDEAARILGVPPGPPPRH